MKILTKSASLIMLSLLATQAQAGYSGRDYRVRCQSNRTEFVLNAANVNALVALSCSALSHSEVERKQMDYKNGATLFHQWTTTGSDVNGIVVKGYCAIPLTDLKSGEYGRHEIDMVFKESKATNGKVSIKALGSIAGKTMDLEFGRNSFIDEGCNTDEDIMDFKSVSKIDLGFTFGLQPLIDLVRSGRTPVTMKLLDQESWTQGRNTGYFSNIGLKYEAVQINARRLGVALVSESATTLVGRSANVLGWHEGDSYFGIKKDSFGDADGFESSSDSDNHKFQAIGIAGGSQMVGCSSLVYDGELDKSLGVDIENCKRKIEKSPLAKFTFKQSRELEETADSTAEQLRKYKVTLEARRIEAYLERTYGPVARYADKPGMYGTGLVAWKAADKSRGFVIQDRNYTIDTEKAVIRVVEFRSDSNGNKSTKRYTVPIEKI